MTRRAALVLAAVAAFLLALVPVGAGAQDGPSRRPSQVLSVDATNQEAVSLLLRSDAPPDEVADVQVADNGTQVEVLSSSPVPAAEQHVVLLLDASDQFEANEGLVPVREAAKAFVEASSGQQIAIYSFSDRVRNLSVFTDDKAVLLDRLETLTPREGSTLWDGITGAARVLLDADVRAGTVVVVTGTPDDGSTGGSATARGSLTAAGARLSVVGVNTPEFGAVRGSLERLASESGGVFRVAENEAGSIATALEDARVGAANQYRVVYSGATEDGLVSGTIRIGAEVVEYEYGAGLVIDGPADLEPTPPASKSTLSFLSSGIGLTVGILLVLVAVAGITYSMATIFSKDNELTDVLSAYTDGYLPEGEEDEAGSIKNAIVQRAVDLTEQVAESQGFLAKVENMLEQASVPLRAAEAIFFYLIAVFVLAVVGLVLMGGIAGMLFMLVLGFLAPPSFVNFRATSRRKKFVAQLPDMLQLLAGTLRAGFSLMQGVEAVSQEVDGPMGEELRRVVTESRLGLPLEEALEGTAERMDSQDFAWTVMAISIQREVGGNLAELLLTVADTMIQRERLRGEISALTAEGRISAIVLGIMPPGLGVVMYSLNPNYTSKLFTDTLGNILLGTSVVGAIIGFVWMKKIIDIDI